jgi:hypothetical protein
MNFHRFACLFSLLVFTSIGCCHTQCVSSDLCDPCGGTSCGTASCDCGSSGSWFNRRLKLRNRHRCRSQGACDGSVCAICGGESCDLGVGDGSCGGGCSSGGCGGGLSAPTSSGCSCGMNNYDSGFSTPTALPSGTVTPQPAVPAAPIPSQPSEPTPAPGSTSSIATPPAGSIGPQQVSYEEFQRLPGVVVSGPTTTSSVPSLVGMPAIPPSPAPLPKAAGSVQQVQWVPVK